MPADISISIAVEADIEEMSHVFLRAVEPEMIDRFMVVEDGFEAAYASKMRWCLSEMRANFADPARRFFKATLKETGAIVGMGAILYRDGTFEEGQPWVKNTEEQPTDPIAVDAPLLPPTAATLPTRKREEFVGFYFGSMRKIYRRHMEGQKHVGWLIPHQSHLT